MVTWKSVSGMESGAEADFLKGCSGIVLQAYPDENSAEPEYRSHHLLDIARLGKRWILMLCGFILLIWGFVSSGLYRNVSTFLLTLVDLGGLGVTWLLILKSLKVKSATADNVCGVLQKHGCDHVLEDKASSFFGVFSWSEVGFAYFSVSLAALLVFPQFTGTLALINGCCLPFTVWSIWYQKFKIKTWCTLCVITQTLLWCQFLCYLLGGWWAGARAGHARLAHAGLPSAHQRRRTPDERAAQDVQGRGWNAEGQLCGKPGEGGRVAQLRACRRRDAGRRGGARVAYGDASGPSGGGGQHRPRGTAGEKGCHQRDRTSEPSAAAQGDACGGIYDNPHRVVALQPSFEGYGTRQLPAARLLSGTPGEATTRRETASTRRGL